METLTDSIELNFLYFSENSKHEGKILNLLYLSSWGCIVPVGRDKVL